jgi:hypothetical protein
MWERDGDVEYAERRVVWAPWSPAQLVAVVIGVLYVVLGAVALAGARGADGGFANAHVSALGFHHTALLGGTELVYGLVLVMAGAVPGAGRGLMAFLGTAAVGFGAVVLAQSPALHDTLGVHEANGWLYILTGVVTLAAGMAAPVFFGRQRRAVEYRSDIATRHGL